jgi:hypothetical protein
LAPVFTVAALTVPPPCALQLTENPETGLPNWSVTFTTSESASAVPTWPIC